MPLTLTVYVLPLPLTDAVPPVAVPLRTTSPASKPVTSSENATSKRIGWTLVGSAWAAAWFTVTAGAVAS
jgi:hypothetical protein